MRWPWGLAFRLATLQIGLSLWRPTGLGLSHAVQNRIQAPIAAAIEPMTLPAGTRVNVTAYYDNSENNPHNPHFPPQWVTWGEETTDEMLVAFLIFTIDSERLTAGQ